MIPNNVEEFMVGEVEEEEEDWRRRWGREAIKETKHMLRQTLSHYRTKESLQTVRKPVLESQLYSQDIGIME